MSIVPISDNGVSRVWLDNGWVYKQQPLFMADNEMYCLDLLYPSGYVPLAIRAGFDVIRLEYIQVGPVTDAAVFRAHCAGLLTALKIAGIRHGDLTEKNLLVRDNHPYLIDFSESRLASDPRPDKRREGDEHWLQVTVERLCPK